MHSMQIEHERVQMHPKGASLTKQAFKKECDINQIMKQYKKNGLLDHLNTHQGNYGSFIGYEDYHSSLNKILEAKDAFYTIPSDIRAKFDNDPSLFIKFAQDEKNYDQMVEMGLAHPRSPSDEGTGPKGGVDPPSPPLPLPEPVEAPRRSTEPKKPDPK